MSMRKKKRTIRKNLRPVNLERDFELREALKTLRTNIMFCISQREKRRILFTSAVPMEGKSSLIVDFAIVLAQTGAKFVLVDGDMRQPNVHRILKCPRKKRGLSSALAYREAEIEITETGYPNLSLLQAGAQPPNPTELLGGIYMEELLQRLETRFDYILLDTPPVNLVADALEASKYNFGIIMVIRENYSEHREFQEALKAVERVGGDLMGAVLVESKHAIQSGKSGYGYHGYGNKKKSNI